MPVTALVAPGPEVTSATPTFCVLRAIAIGRMHCGLLVPNQNVLDLILLEQRVVDVKGPRRPDSRIRIRPFLPAGT
jgi:hypothetical protein